MTTSIINRILFSKLWESLCPMGVEGKEELYFTIREIFFPSLEGNVDPRGKGEIKQIPLSSFKEFFLGGWLLVRWGWRRHCHFFKRLDSGRGNYLLWHKKVKISPTLSKNRSRCWFPPLPPSCLRFSRPRHFFQKVRSGAYSEKSFFFFCWPQTWRKILSSLSSGLFHSLLSFKKNPGENPAAKSFFFLSHFLESYCLGISLKSLSPFFNPPPFFLCSSSFHGGDYTRMSSFRSFPPSSIPPLISSPWLFLSTEKI